MKHLIYLLALGLFCTACEKNTEPVSATHAVVTASVTQSPAAEERLKKFLKTANEAHQAIRAGDDKTAETLLQQVIEMEPAAKSDQGLLAELYVRQGRDKEALAMYRKTFEHVPNVVSTIETNPLDLCKYGELCLRLGLDDEGKRAFLRAIGKKDHFGGRYGNPRFNLLTGSPSDIRASATLVAALDTSGERQKNLLRKAYELKPNWEAAKFYFAYFGRDGSPKDCDRAIEIFHSLRNSSDPLVRSIAKEKEEALITWRKQGYKPGPGAKVTVIPGRM